MFYKDLIRDDFFVILVIFVMFVHHRVPPETLSDITLKALNLGTKGPIQHLAYFIHSRTLFPSHFSTIRFPLEKGERQLKPLCQVSTQT